MCTCVFFWGGGISGFQVGGIAANREDRFRRRISDQEKQIDALWAEKEILQERVCSVLSLAWTVICLKKLMCLVYALNPGPPQLDSKVGKVTRDDQRFEDDIIPVERYALPFS